MCGGLKRSGIMPKKLGKSVLIAKKANLLLSRKMLILLEPFNSGGALTWAVH